MINKRSYVIAVDGYASSGKSTLAKDLAQELEISYVDTGAMYRAVTLYLLDKQIDLSDKPQLINALKKIELSFKFNIQNMANDVFLNNINIEEDIRGLRVSSKVSEVSALKEVRDILLFQQRNMIKNGPIVMDGRDIGTVIFPDAEAKIFVYANEIERAKRRYKELNKKNKDVRFEDVLDNIKHRDLIDTTRKIAPLKQAVDAFRIDNTDIDVKQQLKIAKEYVKKCIIN
ncbi:MAG TPA: (d)CMP kinase [Bacteroidetes bacterium]|nr:(d)CMP kinase [Bacteroidota bacterium]